MDEDQDKKLIGLAEAIFIVLLVAAEELIEFAILLVTLGAGIIIVEIMNGAMFMVIEMYMLLRGGRGLMKLIVQPIGAAINGATGGLAPGKTVALMTGIWIMNHPEKIDRAMGVVAKMTGQVAQVALTAVSGGAGGVAAKVAGGAVAEVAAGKASVAGASAVRQRMAMAARTSSGKIVGAERMIQRRAERNAQQDTAENPPMQQAA